MLSTVDSKVFIKNTIHGVELPAKTASGKGSFGCWQLSIY
jgi:hypothetical protein